MKSSRKGGVVAALLLLVAVFVAIEFVSGIRVERIVRESRVRTRVETPAGNLHLDARDNFNPESVGVPVYPGARRSLDDSAGAILGLDWDGISPKEMSLVAARFTTSDSPEQVRDFYRARLPARYCDAPGRIGFLIRILARGL